MAIDIIINGQSAKIENLREIAIRSSFSRSNFQEQGEDQELEINVDSIVVVGDSINIIKSWIDSYGMGVGIPTVIKVSPTLKLDYYIDLTKEYFEDNEKIECKLIKRKGSDSFFQIARGTSFEILAKQGLIFPTVNVPYKIIKDNRNELALSLSIATWAAGQALLQSIRATANSITLLAESANILDPVGAARAIAQIAINTAFLVANALIAKRLAEQLIEVVWPKTRFFKACKVKELLSTYCNSKGYTLSSTILNALEGLTILPVPMRKENKNIFQFTENELDQSFTNGYPTSLDTVSIVADVFTALETTFNAKTKVRDGVVYLERWDFFSDQTNIQIPVTYSDQERAVNKFTRNAEEAVKRYYLAYQTDPNDTHTRADFAGTIQEVGFENANNVAPDLDLLSGLDNRQIPFALGSRKQETYVEKKAKEILSFKLDIQGFTDVLNLDVSLGSFAQLIGLNLIQLINDNNGVLQISEQFYSTTKLLLLDNKNRQPEDYLSKIGAPALYDNYHSINAITNNARNIFSIRTKMTLDQYEQTVFTEAIDIDGVKCEIADIELNPDNESVTLVYRKPSDWAEGKINKFVL